MAKNKIRCGRCGKRFTASNPKQMFCPECEARLRAERSGAKSAGAKQTAGAAAAQPPKIVGPGASILVPGMAPTRAGVPPELSELGIGRGASQPHDGHGRAPREARAASGAPHGAGAPVRPGAGAHVAPEPPATRPGQEKGQHTQHGQHGQHSERTQPQKAARPPQPREPKAPRPTPPAFVLTDETRKKIEERYLELAQPIEFDGIRTQIAGELSMPKSLVKKAVTDLRARMQLPSWWELQTYTGGNTDLDRIRRAYMPHLPVPPIGIHKAIAQELGLDTGVVYQGIKRIRAEMRLPRFNPPDLHEGESGTRAKTAAGSQEAPGSAAPPAEVANATGAEAR